MEILHEWFRLYVENNYKSHTSIKELASHTNLSIKQVHNWINKKKRSTGLHTCSKWKRKLLRESFLKNSYPNQKEIIQLKSVTGISEKKINSWFAKERFNFKKQLN